MPDNTRLIQGVGDAIGKAFANQNQHSHTGDNNDIYITPAEPGMVPPKEGPQVPSADPYLKYRTEQGI